jgi:hypothetical protein
MTEVEQLRREVESLEAVLADLKQDSTGYVRGLQDGVMQERAAVLMMIGDDYEPYTTLKDRIRTRQPTLTVRPGDCTIRAGLFTAKIDGHGMGRVYLDGKELHHLTMIKVLMRCGEVPVVDLSFHPLPRATQKG